MAARAGGRSCPNEDVGLVAALARDLASVRVIVRTDIGVTAAAILRARGMPFRTSVRIMAARTIFRPSAMGDRDTAVTPHALLGASVARCMGRVAAFAVSMFLGPARTQMIRMTRGAGRRALFIGDMRRVTLRTSIVAREDRRSELLGVSLLVAGNAALRRLPRNLVRLMAVFADHLLLSPGLTMLDMVFPSVAFAALAR